MRPGLTGPWQIGDRARFHSVESMAEADLGYVSRYRLSRDIWILLATIPACLRGGTV
jgi:lipopolysaccharide/colanic/teichoic acid biosynthesis glycosyltransferase